MRGSSLPYPDASVTGHVAGQDLPARTVHVEQVDIIRFAGACGDFNPLHFDAELARRAGFDAPIAMGQMTAGIAASWVADWCGIEQLVEFQVRFLSPVVAGEDLTLTGRVRDLEDEQQTSVVEFNANVSARTVLAGTARVSQGHRKAR